MPRLDTPLPYALLSSFLDTFNHFFGSAEQVVVMRNIGYLVPRFQDAVLEHCHSIHHPRCRFLSNRKPSVDVYMQHVNILPMSVALTDLPLIATVLAFGSLFTATRSLVLSPMAPAKSIDAVRLRIALRCEHSNYMILLP